MELELSHLANGQSGRTGQSGHHSQPDIPEINVIHEDSDEDISAEEVTDKKSPFDSISTRGESVQLETLDPNYVEYSSEAYRMRRDSIRLSLQSSNIDLGNAIECHNISFGYNAKNEILKNVSINVPKGMSQRIAGEMPFTANITVEE